MKKLVLVLTVLAAVSVAMASPTFDVYGQTGTNWNKIGTINPIVTSGSAIDHYAYNTPYDSSGNPAGVNQAFDTVNIWVHQQDGTTGQYSLGLIFSIDDTSKTTSLRYANATIDIFDNPANAGLQVQDDGTDLIKEDPANHFTAGLKFYESKTDGLVISGLEGDQWSAVITVTGATFNSFYAADGGTGDDVELGIGGTYMIAPAGVVVPVPGAFLLGGIGVTCVGWMKRRRSL